MYAKIIVSAWNGANWYDEGYTVRNVPDEVLFALETADYLHIKGLGKLKINKLFPPHPMKDGLGIGLTCTYEGGL
jgi:hypothetical protein